MTQEEATELKKSGGCVEWQSGGEQGSGIIRTVQVINALVRGRLGGSSFYGWVLLRDLSPQ